MITDAIRVLIEDPAGPSYFTPDFIRALTGKLRQQHGVENVVPTRAEDAKSITFDVYYDSDKTSEDFEAQITQYVHVDHGKTDFVVSSEALEVG